MNDNDTNLTAYALNELTDDAERARIEALVANDESARRRVDETRATAKALSAALAREELPEPAKLPSHAPPAHGNQQTVHGRAAHTTKRAAPSIAAPRRWPARLAIAAAASIVVGGVAFSIFAPSLNRAREVAIRTSDAGRRDTGAPRTLASNENIGAYPRNDARGSGWKLNAPLSTPGEKSFSVAPGISERSLGLQSGYSVVTAGPARVASPRDANDSILLPTEEFGDGIDRQNTHFNTEAYDRVVDNAFLSVMQHPLSTFSIDVDTASYANIRRFLGAGQLPPPDAVRIEEMINYFPYDYAPPEQSDERPFAAHVEVTQCPWKPEHRLVRVALKGREIDRGERPACNLVFLLDVSGSMGTPNKLPLVKQAMRLLVNELNERDSVTIAVYAGSSGLVLPATSGADKPKILDAIDNLTPGGSTNGAQGIQLAYGMASGAFKKGGVNRVILCTDGDFNVGVTNQGELTRLIEEKAKSGVFLSVLGFGMGNLKDSTMEKLADKGNGNYAYIDTLNEAKKVLVDEIGSTLVTIAKDVKIQVEFNPATVAGYRLIGYENRLLAREDFNDDTKDAGEIGAGHTVTALYEVVPAGQKLDTPGIDPLKYQPATSPAENAPATAASDELLTLKLRYKARDADKSRLIEVPVTDGGETFARATADLKFASAVASFGMLLRNSPYKGDATFDAVSEWASEGFGNDKSGYRHEFLDLVKKAQALKGQ